MRFVPIALLLAMLLLAPHAQAHGGQIEIRITDKGCSLTDPPCMVADNGASVDIGENTVTISNTLDKTQHVMVHLDSDGSPGAMIEGVVAVAAGESIELTFTVPDTATGVWYMAAGSGDESTQLYGGIDVPHDAPSEDSPGLGLVLVLAALGVIAVIRRS